MSPLEQRLRERIERDGPIPVADYMAEANAHYYATRDPLGRGGDFITAPEISQMFGELIGLWLADLWQRAGAPINLTMKAVPGISLIYDAVFSALTHTPETGRRHLIVAMTDGEDCGSLLDGPRVLDASGRSEAVLHWIYVSAGGDFDDFSVNAWCTPSDARDVDYLGDAAKRTGGDVHRSRFGDPAVRTFSQVLDDFRQSYVLRYSPHNVPASGWHAVSVQVPAQPGVTIRARSGYFGAAAR